MRRQRGMTAGDLAEGVDALVERITSLEERQLGISRALEEVSKAVADAAASHRRTLAMLHRDLLGERKASAALEVFRAVVPALDSLDAMRAGPPARRGRQVHLQLDAAASALRNLVLDLGYADFHAGVGEDFAPERMEALGYGEGAPGVVLAAVRPGYRCGDTVVRPAGVLIADPSASPSDRGDQP
jgi:molecular chaperone GrpE (heat shock protein)